MDTNVVRHRYRIALAIEGRIRFLSHLEMIDTLLAAVRRTGIRLAMSQGMRPKPLIKVAMPRPVAAEAWSDIVEVELAEPIEPGELAERLGGTLPVGVRVLDVVEMRPGEPSAASSVAGATYRVVVEDADAETLEEAVTAFLAAPTVLVPRRTPKHNRDVDVRAAVSEVEVVQADGEGAPAVRFHIRLSQEGSAKPEEVVRALGAVSGRELAATRTIRESIRLARPGSGQVATPALVGVEEPEGPRRPWGSG